MVFLVVEFAHTPFGSEFRKHLADTGEDFIFLDMDLQGSRSETPSFILESSFRGKEPLVVYGADERGAGGFAPIGFSKMSSAEYRAFSTSLDRVYLSPLSSFQRELLFDGWLSGWNSVLSNMDSPVKGAVFTSSPHFPWDLALAKVVQEHGGKVYSFHPSAANGVSLLAEISGAQIERFVSFDEALPVPPSELLGVSENDRILFSKKINQRLLGNRPRGNLKGNLSPLPGIKFLARWARYVLDYKARPYWSGSCWEILILTFRWNSRRKRLLDWLGKTGISQVPATPFAYFALHFQPERSTTPEAGDYWYQVRAIRALRASLPKDLSIIVGEHPRQLHARQPDLRQLLFRDVEFYNQILKIPDVRLASWSLSGDQLLPEASLVATCTGSSAWEAMELGIPAVVFGKTWYSMSAGCVDATDRTDLGPPLARLLKMSRDNVKTSRQQAVDFAVSHGLPSAPYGGRGATITDDEAKLSRAAVSAQRLMAVIRDLSR